jgi:colanic acid biosynthesis glycosyl transferase WcaI
MRILFVGINYWPEENGIEPFSTGRAEYLAARGHEVTFCTTFPYYPAWKLAREHRRSLISREVRRGVTILRTRIYVPSRPNSFKRLFHEGSFVAASLSRMLARRRPDVIFVVSPPLGLAAAGLLLSKLWNVPYLFHVADLQPDAAVDLGMLQAGRLVNLLYRFEPTSYAGSGVVSTLTPAMRSRIVAKGIAADKVVLFQDWTDPRLFDIPASGGEDFRRAFGLEGKFLVTHAGNMGVKQGLEVVLEAAELSSRDPAYCIRVGG